MENLAVSLACDADTLQHRKAQRTALTLACVIGFAFSANYTNHAPLVAALAREFDFNRTLAGLLSTGIFTTHAMLQVPGGHLVDKLGSPVEMLHVFGMSIACLLISEMGWRFSVRHYTSASS